MTLYKATADGDVAMTQEEEDAFVAEQAVYNSVASKKARLRASVNEINTVKGSVGVTVNDVVYNTNFAARLELSNAFVYLIRNPLETVSIESKDGDVVSLDVTGLEAVYDGVNNYTASVATARKAHFDAIRDLTSENVDEYDVDTLWP
jgi:hypothetical protein